MVAEAVGLDHQPEVRPVEVDFELVDDLAGERDRKAGLGGKGEKATFELLLGEAKGAPVEDPAERGDTRLAGSLVERVAKFGRVREVVLVRLVDRPLDPPPVEAQGEVDKGLDRGGDGDAVLNRRVTFPQRRTLVNSKPWATPTRRAG
ncbi:MAG TPA: hypothetical protein VF125_06605 [Solirubrobacterales bacterium]